jgi:RNA polymerase sigma factor (sigma-70 family)
VELTPSDLLIGNLDLVDRVVAFTCRRQRLDEAEREEFASVVKLRLVENDYAVIRKFEGRSSFATFLSVVIQRMLLDYRIHLWGKWHPSAEATRLGSTAVELEQLLSRDGKSIDEAFAVMRASDPSLTPAAIQCLASRLPSRTPRRRMVPLDHAQSVAVHNDPLAARDQLERSERVSEVVSNYLGTLGEDDRTILQLRFETQMSVAQIARALRLDQKQLYRQVEKLLRALRSHLEESGIAATDAADLIGAQNQILEFRFGNRKPRPSIAVGGSIAADEEAQR